MTVNLVNPHDVMYYNTDLPDAPAEAGSNGYDCTGIVIRVSHSSKAAGIKICRYRETSLLSGRIDRQPIWTLLMPAPLWLAEFATKTTVGDGDLNCIQSVDGHVSSIRPTR